jgi:hypothetical protein
MLLPFNSSGNQQFAELEDPRGLQGVEHPFLSIVMIAILAVIGGATGWEDIETYAESHEAWLSTLLALPNGVPHADTYRRLFERMAPRCPRALLYGLGKADCRGQWCPGDSD